MSQRKFAALAGIRNATKQPADAPATSVAVSVHAELREPKGRGRPAGKRSNPDYEPTTLLLRKETKKRASRLLEDIGNRQDLSDLTEQLLSNWIDQQA